MREELYNESILNARIKALEIYNSILELENEHLTESIKQLREALEKERANNKIKAKDIVYVALIGLLAIFFIYLLDFLSKL